MISYNTSVVRNGLVLHLDAANVKSYPGSGTAWNDLSGNENHGTMTSTDYETANNGSFLFNSTSDTIVINHDNTFNFGSNFTVSAWIKVNSFINSIYNVISKKPSFNNTQKGWSCQYDYRTTGVLQFRNNNGTVLNDHTPTSNVDNTGLLNQTQTWVNSVWSITPSNVTFYINGVSKGTLNIIFSDTDTSTPIYIGKTTGSIGDPSLLMNMGMIFLYNRSLSIDEIQKSFNATRGRYGV